MPDLDLVSQVLELPRGESGHPRYEQVREHGDLVRGRNGTVMTASHAVCNQVLRNNTFGAVSSTVAKHVLRPARPGTARLVHPLDDSFASIDPPEHARLRKVVAPAFSAQAMRDLATSVERITAEQLDRLDRTEPVDLIGEFALRVPSAVICRLLGVPQADHPRFVRWGLEFSAVVDGARTASDLHRTRVLLTEMADYFREQLALRARRPSEDLITVLATAVDDGEMTELGALATCESLLIGGFVTTANIIGNGVLALLADHAQRDLFVARPALADAVVEETLRFEAPAQYSVRIAHDDVTLAGQDLPAGTPVITLLAAANRDPSVFDRPHEFDILRPNGRDHLAFAAGIHYCIGAGLARLEGAVALRALFERFPRLEVAGPVRYCLSRVIRGPRYLPVGAGPTGDQPAGPVSRRP